MPIEHGLSQESSLLVVLADDVKPLVVASGDLAAIHPDDEVTHDSVSLRLHFGDEIRLSTLVLLNLNFEM